jgi:hypothetical protein
VKGRAEVKAHFDLGKVDQERKRFGDERFGLWLCWSFV